MENGNLSPKALSKPIHKVSSWITPSLKKNFDRFFKESKLSMKHRTKSEIVMHALELMYFCEPFTQIPNAFNKEKPHCRITFYLSPESIQNLWDIESHYAAEGKKITISLIIQLALESYIYN